MTNTIQPAAVETITWITLDHAAVLAGYSVRTLSAMIKTGRAPAPHRFSARRVRYSEKEFREWLAARVEAARVAGAGERV
jgi:predicted DNA-binding transcriptional regulator AlpA